MTKVDKGMILVNQDTAKRDKDTSQVDKDNFTTSFYLFKRVYNDPP